MCPAGLRKLMDVWIISTVCPLGITWPFAFMCKFLCDVFSAPVGLYRALEFLGHGVTLSLTF